MSDLAEGEPRNILDEHIAGVLFAAQLQTAPRVMRHALVFLDQCIVLPGTLFPDQLARAFIHPRAAVDEAALIAQLDRKSEPRARDASG